MISSNIAITEGMIASLVRRREGKGREGTKSILGNEHEEVKFLGGGGDGGWQDKKIIGFL